MWRLLLAFIFTLAAAGSAHAHKLAPSLLALAEQGGGRFAVTWKTPRYGPTPTPVVAVLPAGCQDAGQRAWQYEGTGVRVEWLVQCATALPGSSIRVDGLAENQSAALLRITWQDGRTEQAMLSGSTPAYTVATAPSALGIAGEYAHLGVVHILGGIDHLLFVLGLLLLVANRRALVITITAFTAGHSVTLALAALGFLRYPVDLVEFAIAASIFVVAVELTRGDDARHWLRRRPWLAAAGFGLLHGMGFAGALLEVGLPQQEIPLALLCFNLGIEVGQLLFVAAAGLVMIGARRAWARGTLPGWPLLRWAPVYLIGVASAYWCIERGATVLGA